MNTFLNREFEYSAVITTYKPSNLLQVALRSILNQSIKPREIVLIDDCSDGIELGQLQSLIPECINFVYHKNFSNLGAGNSRNVGVSLTSRKFVIFFDDDDESTSERSKLHWMAFQKGATVSYVSSRKKYPSGFQVDFPNFEISPRHVDPRKMARKLLYGDSLRNSIGEIPAATLAITKSQFLAVGGFDHTLRRLEDVDLAIRLSLNDAIFSWSSAIAVDRNATSRQNKGGQIETQHEQVILLKYGHLLGRWREQFASAHIVLRSVYFSGISSPKAFLSIIRAANLFSILILFARFPRLISRLRHDWLKRNK